MSTAEPARATVLDFLGAINPWPASRSVADVVTHKSRLILQSQAIQRSIDPGPWERLVARALDHGAAVWELWLLEHAGEALEDRKGCARSAVSLAQRSGDWALVGDLLATWAKVGEGHERFYRDAKKSHDAHRADFDKALARIKSLGRQVQDTREAAAARRLLAATEVYADRGGSAYVLWYRGLARVILAERDLARREAFMACVASPHDPTLAEQWILRSRSGELASERTDVTRARAVAWFSDELTVQTAALLVAVDRATAGSSGPSDAEIERVIELAMSSRSPERVRAFAIFNAAWALTERKESSRAFEVLDEALRVMPSQNGLLILRANAALAIGHSRALDDLFGAAEASGLTPEEWRLVANILSRGRRWANALAAYEHAGASIASASAASDEVRWLNDYAVVLAHNGLVLEARELLERAVREAPDHLEARRNLAALDEARLQDLEPANDNMFKEFAKRGAA